ncbi:MAG: SIS domain-containing protein [Candidatus Kapaibacterium sp.]|jgi:D-sedoheptulose 7-phosphate isomerase
MNNFSEKIAKSVKESISVKQKLIESASESIENCGNILADSIKQGGKILFCGNGGSAADAQHLAAELVVRLRSSVNRPALPGIALTVDSSILTAGGNDIGFDNVFARAVEAYGKDGDVLVAISTSGNSENVIRAVKTAKSLGIVCIGLLGGMGGKMLGLCDYHVTVPSSNTARIQESHIMIGHIWCEMIEEILFPDYFSK